MEEMIAAAKEAIRASSPESGVYIGCDSIRRKKRGRFVATYATVVIVHRDSKHGGQIFSFVETQQDYGSMKARLMNEVGYAVQVGWEVADEVGERPFQIHLDLNPNPNHKSNVAVKEASGYVLGTFGFPPMLKPEAFAATYAADELARR